MWLNWKHNASSKKNIIWFIYLSFTILCSLQALLKWLLEFMYILLPLKKSYVTRSFFDVSFSYISHFCVHRCWLTQLNCHVELLKAANIAKVTVVHLVWWIWVRKGADSNLQAVILIMNWCFREPWITELGICNKIVDSVENYDISLICLRWHDQALPNTMLQKNLVVCPL